MREEFVMVNVEEYKRLLAAEAELEELEAAGVDNWSGYGEVEWASLEDNAESTLRAIAGMPKYDRLGDLIK